jgi:ethanolamine ammonia-lyase small subunit
MAQLSDFTSARVDLGRAGDSLPSRALLDFRLAHARARDAVHLPLDTTSMTAEMAAHGWSSVPLTSQAATRQEYLLRPDLGRTLSEASHQSLRDFPKPQATVIAVADGLSALAVHRHAVPLLEALEAAGETIGTLFVIQQGRVAISDDLGETLQADLCVLLIGERPGLSSPDSLGVYLTWRPHRGCTDAQRNCVSNIHQQGLSYQAASQKIAYLISESRRLKLTGVALKERADQIAGSLRSQNVISK